MFSIIRVIVVAPMQCPEIVEVTCDYWKQVVSGMKFKSKSSIVTLSLVNPLSSRKHEDIFQSIMGNEC